MNRFIEKIHNIFRLYSYTDKKRRNTTSDCPSISQGATIPPDKIQDVIDVFHDIAEHTEIHYGFLNRDNSHD